MKEPVYERYISNRTITSCVVVSKTGLFFYTIPDDYEILEGNDEKYPEHIFYYNLSKNSDNPEDYTYYSGHYFQLKLTCAKFNGKNKLLGITHDGDLYYYNKIIKGFSGTLPPPPKPFYKGGINNARCIGEHFYAVGFDRKVYRYNGVDDWAFISESAYADDLKVDGIKGGFESIDGFSETDIYAAGGEGHVWHYNGQIWDRVDIPTNEDLYSICCADDGHVYIGGSSHTVLRGRGEQWKIISKGGGSGDTLKQIMQFKSKVYTVDSWGTALYELDENGMKQTNMNGYEILTGGCVCMAEGDGVMIVAGHESASMFNGEYWTSLFEPECYREQMEEVRALQYATHEMDKVLDEMRGIVQQSGE